MNEVFDKTRQLADALMASEEYIQMKAAEDKAAQNPEAAELMRMAAAVRIFLKPLIISHG